MLNIPVKKLNALKKKFGGKKIAVIGDMMLDCYFWGVVGRISPEAPVPVVEVDNEFYRFGGASNVAYNISTLGGTPLPIGVTGNDNEGKILRSLMNESNISDKSLVVDKSRPTTAKTRVIANKQHVVRIDKESTLPVSHSIEKKMIDILKKEIRKIDAVILQDYNKGVLTKSFIEQVIEIANESKKIITVDPKFKNFFSYQNVTVFKPNRKEIGDALGIKIESEEEIEWAGFQLMEKLNSQYILLTLSEHGVALFEDGNSVRRIPAKARKVADVSGAGDTVIATLTMALAAGADIYDAAYLANYAGSLVCQEIGIVPIELNTLFNSVADELK